MRIRMILAALLIVLLVGSASVTLAQGTPDPIKSFVATEGIPPGVIAVSFNLPTDLEIENRPGLLEAMTLDGMVDGTITLYIRDSDDKPVSGVVAELRDLTGNLISCVPSWGDDASDDDGKITWSEYLYFGGSSQEPLTVFIDNVEFMPCDVPLHHNSPDINADTEVFIGDVQKFALDFYSGSYAFRSDFNYDGILNLSDVPRLAGNWGLMCE